MIQIPLENLTTLGAEDFSMVIWSGEELIVSKDKSLNLLNIKLNINELENYQLLNPNKSNSYSLKIDDLDEKLQKLKTYNLVLNTNVQALRDLTQDINSGVSIFEERILKLEEQNIKNTISVQSILDNDSAIKKGVLTSYSEVLEVKTNKLGKITIIDNDMKVIPIIGGENLIVTYIKEDMRYNLKGIIPKISTTVKQGSGVIIDEDQSESLNIRIRDDLFYAKNGLEVENNKDGSFIVSTSSNFIQGDVHRGVSVYKNLSGFFSVNLTQSILNNLGKSYSGGYGIIVDKGEISIDSNLIPTLDGEKGIKVAKTKNEKNVTYEVKFDLDTAEIPPHPNVYVEYPLTITSKDIDSRFNVKEYKVELDENYKTEVNTKIQKLETLVEKTKNHSNDIKMWDLTLGLKKSLASPIYKLFKAAIGDYEGAGIVKDNQSTSYKLYQKYGFGSTKISIEQDMLPYLVYGGSTGSSTVDISSSVNLFLILQDKLRVDLGDANFTIPNEDKNKVFKIKSVKTSEAESNLKPTPASYQATSTLEILTTPSSINFQTGDANFTLRVNNATVGYSTVPVSQLISKLSMPVEYEIYVDQNSVFDQNHIVKTLFTDSCWGNFNPLKFLRCGIDDQIINPTNDFIEVTTTTTTGKPGCYFVEDYVDSEYTVCSGESGSSIINSQEAVYNVTLKPPILITTTTTTTTAAPMMSNPQCYAAMNYSDSGYIQGQLGRFTCNFSEAMIGYKLKLQFYPYTAPIKYNTYMHDITSTNFDSGWHPASPKIGSEAFMLTVFLHNNEGYLIDTIHTCVVSPDYTEGYSGG